MSVSRVFVWICVSCTTISAQNRESPHQLVDRSQAQRSLKLNLRRSNPLLPLLLRLLAGGLRHEGRVRAWALGRVRLSACGVRRRRRARLRMALEVACAFARPSSASTPRLSLLATSLCSLAFSACSLAFSANCSLSFATSADHDAATIERRLLHARRVLGGELGDDLLGGLAENAHGDLRGRAKPSAEAVLRARVPAEGAGACGGGPAAARCIGHSPVFHRRDRHRRDRQRRKRRERHSLKAPTKRAVRSFPAAWGGACCGKSAATRAAIFATYCGAVIRRKVPLRRHRVRVLPRRARVRRQGRRDGGRRGLWCRWQLLHDGPLL